jgi:hypothetical protein
MRLPFKASVAILAFVVIAALPDLIPALQNYRIVNWSRLGTVAEFTSKRTAAPMEEEKARLRPDKALDAANIYPLLNSGGALDPFLRRAQGYGKR